MRYFYTIIQIIFFLFVNIVVLDSFYLMRYCIPSIYVWLTDFNLLSHFYLEDIVEIIIIGIIPIIIKIIIFYSLYKMIIKNCNIKWMRTLLEQFRCNKVFQILFLIFIFIVIPLYCKHLVTSQYYTMTDYIHYIIWYHLFYGSGFIYLTVFVYWDIKDKKQYKKSRN